MSSADTSAGGQHGVGGRKHTSKEVAAFCAARTGESFSPEYVSQLRRQHRDNPTKHNLEALAGSFDVSPAYFFDDEQSEQIRAPREPARALRDNEVCALVPRDLTSTLTDTAGRMSVKDLRLLTDVVRSVAAGRGKAESEGQ